MSEQKTTTTKPITTGDCAGEKNATRLLEAAASQKEEKKEETSKQHNHRHTKVVRFNDEAINLQTRVEPISLETFESLMDDEEEPTYKPFFLFARVHSTTTRKSSDDDDDDDEKKKHCYYKHLYSAQNIVGWYPLVGITDPCTRANIVKIEYFYVMKGECDAVHVGNVYQKTDKEEEETEQEQHHVSRTADYLIWSLTATDEPSKMMAILAMAYLQYLGITNISSNDTFDTSNIVKLGKDSLITTTAITGRRQRSLKQQKMDQLNASKLYHYVTTHLSKLVECGEIVCSDTQVLVSSIKHDAAHHLAGILVSQDPSVSDDSVDYAQIPHIRTNALTMAIMKHCAFFVEW